MNDSTADKIISAYSANPLWTGILLLIVALMLLLIGLVGAFGWYQLNKDGKVDSFIVAKEERITELQKELLNAVRECRTAK